MNLDPTACLSSSDCLKLLSQTH